MKIVRSLVAGMLIVSIARGILQAASPLRAEFQAMAVSPRTAAPASATVKLHWQGSGLLEGVLELTVTERGEPLLRQRSQELTLGPGTQVIALMVPPFETEMGRRDVSVELKFISKQQSVALGVFPWSVGAPAVVRQFLIANCGAPRRNDADLVRLWQAIRLEGSRTTEESIGRSVRTLPATLEVEELPSTPLGFCAFDLVLLEGDSFRRLREKQLVGLSRWVEGGGSLYVVPNGPLPEGHLQFLNQLAAVHERAPFSLDPQDRLVSALGERVMLRPELGRCVIDLFPPDELKHLDFPAWRETVDFLWRRSAGSGQGRDTGVRAEIIRRFSDQLLPKEARLIPIPVLAGMLGAFLLLIGPGEWMGLGAIRRRRWTWLTFPISTALLTVATFAAAERYLGTADHRTAVTIVDVGKGGRVLREHRLEMIFAAREREGISEMRHSLVVPTASSWKSDAAEITYEGQVPARSVMRQKVRQWVPQLNRHFSFEATVPVADIRWDAVTAEELLSAPGDPGVLFRQKTGLSDRYQVTVVGGGRGDPKVPSRFSALPGFLSEICVVPELRLGTRLVGFSPSGSGSLEDLALVDPSDRREIVLIVVEDTAPGLRIYRRKYRARD
jgi:hypothetical protein